MRLRKAPTEAPGIKLGLDQDKWQSFIKKAVDQPQVSGEESMS